MYGQENFRVNSAVIKVMGVGGGGCNAINSMIESNVNSAEFISVNTDNQALLLSKAEKRLQIGEKLTKGLGAGSNPEIGEAAAEENKEEIREMLEGTDLLFIAAGMGGGTGTGAASVIARIAREMKILTVAVVTKPFTFEGRVRNENANKGITNLRKYVDTLVIIPNDKLLQFLPNNVGMLDAFKVADDMLKQGIIGIVDLIATPSHINLDFADVDTVMRDQGLAHMGIGRQKAKIGLLSLLDKPFLVLCLKLQSKALSRLYLTLQAERTLCFQKLTTPPFLFKELLMQTPTLFSVRRLTKLWLTKLRLPSSLPVFQIIPLKKSLK